MDQPALRILRDRLPAIVLTALFHVLAIALLLRAIPVSETPKATEPESIMVLLPEHEPPLRTARPHRAPRGSNAITTTLPQYILPPEWRREPNVQGLSLALASCAPDNLDMQSDEVRDVCGRIGALIAHDPTIVAGAETGIVDKQRWQHELLVKQTPLLLPCMTPGGPDILYLLLCVYDVMANGYHAENMQHYTK